MCQFGFKKKKLTWNWSFQTENASSYECLFDIGNCKSGLIAYNLTAILHENGSAYYNFAANMHEDRKIQAEEVPYVEPNVYVHER